MISINTEVEYKSALQRVDTIWNADPGTPDGSELSRIIAFIEAYETKNFQIGLPDPEEAEKFRRDQNRDT